MVLKGKMLGNIKFIGELGKRQLISERILHECIKQLLSKVRNVAQASRSNMCCLQVDRSRTWHILRRAMLTERDK